MLLKRIVLATAGVFLCLNSFVSAQDLSFLQNETDYFTAAKTQSNSAAVSSLPTEVLQPQSATVADINSEEFSAAHQADFYVLLGLGGILLAAFSLAGILWITHKRAASKKSPVTLVGV